MTYAELVAIIEPLGYPIAMPGESNVTLPCFQLNPQGITLEEGFPVAYEICEINARVPMDQNNPAQWDESRRMIYGLMNEFMGGPVMFDAEIEVTSDVDLEPPQIWYSMTVQFAGEPICEPTVLLIDEANANPELVTYLTA